MIFWLFLACFADNTAKEKEDVAFDLAYQAQEKIAVEKANQKESSVQKEQTEQIKKEKIDVIFGWKQISPLHQSFFMDSEGVDILRKGLQLPSPALVQVRWYEEEFHRGYGQISVIIEKEVTDFSQLQGEADTLLKYRQWVGNNFDMRLLSFSLMMEGGDCRLPILNKSALKTALISPCLEYKGEKICADVTKEGKHLYSKKMQIIMKECFQAL